MLKLVDYTDTSEHSTEAAPKCPAPISLFPTTAKPLYKGVHFAEPLLLINYRAVFVIHVVKEAQTMYLEPDPCDVDTGVNAEDNLSRCSLL